MKLLLDPCIARYNQIFQNCFFLLTFLAVNFVNLKNLIVSCNIRDDIVKKDLKCIEDMSPDWPVWVPKNVLKRSMKFSEFTKIASNYHGDLEKRCEIYENGEMEL
jgi:hypothetical protein